MVSSSCCGRASQIRRHRHLCVDPRSAQVGDCSEEQSAVCSRDSGCSGGCKANCGEDRAGQSAETRQPVENEQRPGIAFVLDKQVNMKLGKSVCTTLVSASLLMGACKKSVSGTYALRSYGTWTIGESRTCLFAKNTDDAPCFSTEQIRNGSQEPQHEYLVEVTFDRPIPLGNGFGPYSLRCRLESNSRAWCHVEENRPTSGESK